MSLLKHHAQITSEHYRMADADLRQCNEAVLRRNVNIQWQASVSGLSGSARVPRASATPAKAGKMPALPGKKRPSVTIYGETEE